MILGNTNKSKGIVFQLIAVFTVVIMTSLVKFLSDTQTIVAIAFYQNSLALLAILLYFILTKKMHLVKTNNPYLHIKRSVTGNIGMFLVFTAFSMLPLADMAAFMLSVPLIASLLAVVMLNEKISKQKLSVILFGFLGVLLIAKPAGEMMIEGVAIALVAIFFVALVSIQLRDMGKTEHAITTSFYYFLYGTIVTAPFMFFVFRPIQEIEFILIAGCVITGIANQVLKAEALRHADVATILPLNYTSIIWATMVGWLVWAEFPDLVTWTGVAIIISCSFISIRMDKETY